MPQDDPLQDLYEVDTILDCKKYRGKWMFKVKWLGYPDSENSWIFESNFEGSCGDYIEAFTSSYPEKPSAECLEQIALKRKQAEVYYEKRQHKKHRRKRNLSHIKNDFVTHDAENDSNCEDAIPLSRRLKKRCKHMKTETDVPSIPDSSHTVQSPKPLSSRRLVRMGSEVNDFGEPSSELQLPTEASSPLDLERHQLSESPLSPRLCRRLVRMDSLIDNGDSICELEVPDRFSLVDGDDKTAPSSATSHVIPLVEVEDTAVSNLVFAAIARLQNDRLPPTLEVDRHASSDTVAFTHQHIANIAVTSLANNKVPNDENYHSQFSPDKFSSSPMSNCKSFDPSNESIAVGVKHDRFSSGSGCVADQSAPNRDVLVDSIGLPFESSEMNSLLTENVNLGDVLVEETETSEAFLRGLDVPEPTLTLPVLHQNRDFGSNAMQPAGDHDVSDRNLHIFPVTAEGVCHIIEHIDQNEKQAFLENILNRFSELELNQLFSPTKRFLCVFEKWLIDSYSRGSAEDVALLRSSLRLMSIFPCTKFQYFRRIARVLREWVTLDAVSLNLVDRILKSWQYYKDLMARCDFPDSSSIKPSAISSLTKGQATGPMASSGIFKPVANLKQVSCSNSEARQIRIGKNITESDCMNASYNTASIKIATSTPDHVMSRIGDQSVREFELRSLPGSSESMEEKEISVSNNLQGGNGASVSDRCQGRHTFPISIPKVIVPHTKSSTEIPAVARGDDVLLADITDPALQKKFVQTDSPALFVLSERQGTSAVARCKQKRLREQTYPVSTQKNSLLAAAKLSRRPICRYFVNPKGCNSGSSCKFRHASDAAKEFRNGQN
uniref:Chromo domain-containing protein n=1 Tax=Spongospora subterranea TaxID=70186 RepID=A0A0H5QLN8_9EUKA|eukprot:CRZ02918.1 hypothetical protein [Spongospora subterranea]